MCRCCEGHVQWLSTPWPPTADAMRVDRPSRSDGRPPGGTSGVPLSRQRSTLLKERFLLNPTLPQFSHPRNLQHCWEGLAFQKVGNGIAVPYPGISGTGSSRPPPRPPRQLRLGLLCSWGGAHPRRFHPRHSCCGGRVAPVALARSKLVGGGFWGG